MMDNPDVLIDVRWLDWLGWFGFLNIALFYYYLSIYKVVRAYGFCIIGGLVWIVIGVATQLGYATGFLSIIAIQIMAIGFSIRGIFTWKELNKCKEKGLKRGSYDFRF